MRFKCQKVPSPREIRDLSTARQLYRETEASRDLRLKLAEDRSTLPHFEASREGNPSARDRRELNRLRGRSWPRNRTA